MSTPHETRQMTDDEVFDRMGVCQPGAVARGAYEAEIARRQFAREAEVAGAQIRAANAQEIAARWTRWSVAVGAVSLVLAAAGLWLKNGG